MALAVAGCLRGVGDAGLPVAAWGLACAEGDARGDWLQPCVRRALTTPGSKAESWVAIDPSDPARVLVGTKDLDPSLSDECVWTGHAITEDAGASWREVRIAGNYSDRQPGSPFFGWACATDPMFAFERDGTLHVVIEMYGAVAQVPGAFAAGTRIVLATSEDGGRTFPLVQDLVAGDGYALSPDYPRIVVDASDASVHVSLLDLAHGAPCYVVSVRDGAVDAPVLLATPVDAFGCTTVEASPAGTLVVSATGPSRGLTPPTSSIPDSRHHFARSADDGRTFGAWEAGFAFERPPEEVPGIAHHLGDNFDCAYDLSQGDRRGTMYCVYADYAAGDADVLLRASADDAASWLDASPVSAARGRHEFMANVAVADDGSVHVVHLVAGAGSDAGLLHVVHAASADGGRTWTHRQVTRDPSDGSRGRHQDGYAWWGDYLGIDAVGSDVWLAFPDASTTPEPTLAAARARRE